jgi:hypothetical protein
MLAKLATAADLPAPSEAPLTNHPADAALAVTAVSTPTAKIVMSTRNITFDLLPVIDGMN